MTTIRPEDDLEALVDTETKADEATTTQTPPAPGNVVDSAGTTVQGHWPYDEPQAKDSATVTEEKAVSDDADSDDESPFRRPLADAHWPYDRPKPPEPPVNP